MKSVLAAPHHGNQFRYLVGGSIQLLAFRLDPVLDSAVAASQQSGHPRAHLNVAMKDVHGHIDKLGHDDLLEIALMDQNNVFDNIVKWGKFHTSMDTYKQSQRCQFPAQ